MTVACPMSESIMILCFHL